MLGKDLTDGRKFGVLWLLRLDDKTQMMIAFVQRADGSVDLRRFLRVDMARGFRRFLRHFSALGGAPFSALDGTQFLLCGPSPLLPPPLPLLPVLPALFSGP